jgi:hypothetical protein
MTRIASMNTIHTHKIHNLGIIAMCPTNSSTKLLNISSYTRPFIGDDVMGYGNGDGGSIWKGYVSNIFNANENNEVLKHGNGTTTTSSSVSEEYVVASFQHGGHSGGPAAGGCGYIGMIGDVNVNSNYCLIISAKTITDFISEKWDSLPTLESCSLITSANVINMPVFPFINCKIEDVSSPQCQEA